MAMDANANNTGHKAEDQARAAADPVPPDARALARDWIDLWQSELSALNVDPAVREGWRAVASLWAGAMPPTVPWPAAAKHAEPAAPARHDEPARRAGAADAAGAASAPVAPDPRDAEIARLSSHVAALEDRVAALERAGAPGAAPKRRSRAKP